MSDTRSYEALITGLAEAREKMQESAQALYVRQFLLEIFGMQREPIKEDAELSFSAKALETVGVDLFRRRPGSTLQRNAWERLLWRAFRIRRAVIDSAASVGPVELSEIVIDGVLANRQPELRLLLKDIDLDHQLGETDLPRDAYLLHEVLRGLKYS